MSLTRKFCLDQILDLLVVVGGAEVPRQSLWREGSLSAGGALVDGGHRGAGGRRGRGHPPPDFGPLLFALRKTLCLVLNILIEIAFTLFTPIDAGTNSSTFRWMKPMWEAKLGFLLKKQTT